MKDRYVLATGYPSLSECDDPYLIGMDMSIDHGPHIRLDGKVPRSVLDGWDKYRLVLERVKTGEKHEKNNG